MRQYTWLLGSLCCPSCISSRNNQQLRSHLEVQQRHSCAGHDLCPQAHMGGLLPAARAEKARALFPRPTAGPLRPVVRGQTIKYNSKQKLGRGFSLEELKVCTSCMHCPLICCTALTVAGCRSGYHRVGSQLGLQLQRLCASQQQRWQDSLRPGGRVKEPGRLIISSSDTPASAVRGFASKLLIKQLHTRKIQQQKRPAGHHHQCVLSSHSAGMPQHCCVG